MKKETQHYPRNKRSPHALGIWSTRKTKSSGVLQVTSRAPYEEGKSSLSPHTDTGDFIVVINARHVRLTGKKLQDKQYYRHTGYPGGIRQRSAEQLIKSSLNTSWKKAVAGMLPKNALGTQVVKKLKSILTHPTLTLLRCPSLDKE